MNDIFKMPIQEGPEDQEVLFLPSDWQAMAILLDAEMPAKKTRIFPIFFNNKFKFIKSIFIPMIATILLTASLLMVNTFHVKNTQSTTTKQHFNSSEFAEPNPPIESMESIIASTSAQEFSVPVNNADFVQIDKEEQQNLVGIHTTDVSPDSTLTSDSMKFYRVVTRRYKTNGYTKRVYVNPNHDFDKIWLGIHYAAQSSYDESAWNNVDRRINNGGFSLQIMSGNVFKNVENYAIYGGFEWGVQFYNGSRKDTVLINSKNEDRGFSRMNSFSHDLLTRWHFEYARFPVIPYANLGFGTRIYHTSQSIKAMASSTEYESSTSHNVLSRATWMSTCAVGAHFRIIPQVHLDVRYEWMPSGSTSVVNYRTTTFDGNQYQVQKNSVDLTSGQFKIGILFQIENEYKSVYQEGKYIEDTVELWIDSTENSMMIPCDQPTKNYYRRMNHQNCEDEEDNSIRIPSIFGGSGSGGSSGSGKGGFPGLKSPTPKPIGH